MSNSQLFELTQDEIAAIETKLSLRKEQYNYKVNLTEDHTVRFLRPPSQYDLATAKGRANSYQRRISTLNRLKEKLAQRNQVPKIE